MLARNASEVLCAARSESTRHREANRLAFFPENFRNATKGSGKDVKTTQELMRLANRRITLDVYTQALTPAKRAGHLKVVELIRPVTETASLVFPRVGIRICKCLILWSGLSESNRHLNLGKVPYYHYTKAAQRPSFYSMPARQGQVSSANAGPNLYGQTARTIRKPG
jgi:hypothetical protein